MSIKTRFPQNLRLHIINCCEIMFDCNALKFLTLFFQTYPTTYPKQSKTYEVEPAFYRKYFNGKVLFKWKIFESFLLKHPVLKNYIFRTN